MAVITRTDKRVYLRFKQEKAAGRFKTFPEFQRALLDAWEYQNIVKKNISKVKFKGLPKWF